MMSLKVMDVPDGLFGSKTLSVIYFQNPQIKSWSMRISLVIFDSNHLDFNQEARRTSPKVMDVPDGLFGSSLVIFDSSHLDSNQKG